MLLITCIFEILQVRVVTLTERVITMERKLGEYAKKEDVDKCSEDVSTIQETLLMYDQRISQVESTSGGNQSFSPITAGSEGVPGGKDRCRISQQGLDHWDITWGKQATTV